MFSRKVFVAAIAVLSAGIGTTILANPAPAATPQVTEISPTDDSDVTYERPALTNGASHRLRAGFSYGETKETFLKFSVSALAANTSISQATLRLTRDNEPLPSSVSLWSVQSNSWSEQSLTAGSRPGHAALIKTLNPVRTAASIEFDLSSIVKPGATYSFALTSSSGLARFHAKEAGTQGPKLVLATSTTTTTSPAPPPPPPTTSAPSPPASREAQVLSLVNVERQKVGCAALQNDAQLANAARGHSADMAKRNFFSHTNPDGRGAKDRILAAGYPARYWGENIAAGYKDAAAVMRSWMNSTGHRNNILNCNYTQIGVGVVDGGSYGNYWTQDFGSR